MRSVHDLESGRAWSLAPTFPLGCVERVLGSPYSSGLSGSSESKCFVYAACSSRGSCEENKAVAQGRKMDRSDISFVLLEESLAV